MRDWDIKKVQKLLNRGLDVNATDESGQTALMGAAYTGQVAMARLLIAKGADVNAADKFGDTALTTFAKFCDHDDHENQITMTSLLIAKGADVNAADKLGDTALMNAAQKGCVEIAATLLRNGAVINAVTESGETALDIARHCRRQNVVDLLTNPPHFSQDRSRAVRLERLEEIISPSRN